VKTTLPKAHITMLRESPSSKFLFCAMGCKTRRATSEFEYIGDFETEFEEKLG
jgi:hypothetical protein